MTNIEEHIRKAIEEGQFDNLPGKGKPLKLDENPHENPEWRLAYTLLKNSGFSLPWLEERRELEEVIEKAQADLKRAWGWRQGVLNFEHPDLQTENRWQCALETYRIQILAINKRILSHNLSVPSAHFHMLAVDADTFVAELTSC